MNKKHTKSLAPIGASLVVLSSFFYASYGIWTRLMGNFFGGYMASALRSILIVLLLFPIAVISGQLQPINWKRCWRYFAGLIFVSFFVWGPLYYAILHAGIGISLSINYASIVIGIFFFGWLLAGERLTRDKLLAAGLGIIGLGLIFSPSINSIGWLALCAALVSGAAAGAAMVMTKQIPYNATQTTLVLWITSVIANIFMAVVFREHIPPIGPHVQWAYLPIFAVASIIASWSFIAGVKRIEAGAAGILGLMEIVFGVLFGVLLFHERPGIVVMAGVLTVIGAAAIPYVEDYNSQQGTLEEVSS